MKIYANHESKMFERLIRIQVKEGATGLAAATLRDWECSVQLHFTSLATLYPGTAHSGNSPIGMLCAELFVSVCPTLWL